MSQQRSRRPTFDAATGPHANEAAGRKPAFDELKALQFRHRGERSRRQRDLQEPMEILFELNRRKDEFLAMLSHELRNPLGAIRNAVHVLGLLEHEDAIQEKARTIIEHQVAQLTRLVDDMMEVSRIATGKLDLRQDRVLMSCIVERAVETIRPLMSQRKHEFEVSLSGQPVWLFADAARLEQVVVNLLVNAAKYTAEGGHIWMTVGQEDGECVLRVRDTGVGIAPEILPRIFDLFTQEKRSQEQSCGGLGIGLALVKRFVEMHEGRVEVDSSPGQGSEFVVRIPVVSPATQPSAPAGHLKELGILRSPRPPLGRDSMVL